MSFCRAITRLRTGKRGISTLLVFLALTTISFLSTTVQAATVLSSQKISAIEGGFTGVLDDEDHFGATVATIGDVDNDEVVDIAVGAPLDDDGGDSRGAVWILFMNTDGTVKGHQKISDTAGEFDGVLNNADRFSRVASLGDLDNDGVPDLAVGADGDDDGGDNRGAVWILFLNTDGTVKSHQKISSTEGGFAGLLSLNDNFGWSVTRLPDFDDDGVPELAVGATGDDDGASNAGAVYVLFLNADGTVKDHQKISATRGWFTGTLDVNDSFGHAVAAFDDLDNDGVPDLAVGAIRDDDGSGQDQGAVWILFLNSDGRVKGHQKISATEGGFTGTLDQSDWFGRVTSVPDINEDGVQDLAVGAPYDDGAFPDRGAVWLLFLNSDGTVWQHKKIRNPDPGIAGGDDGFGWSGAWLGDLNSDGHGDLAVGVIFDNDGGTHCGAVWSIYLGELRTAVPETGSPGVLSFAASPNPLRSHSTLDYALASATEVRLSIFGPQGRRVATLVDREQPAGSHAATWSGRDDTGAPVSAGIYFARLEASGRTAVRKIVVMR